MSTVTLDNIVKRFGTFTAVHPTNLEIPEGTFLTLLGPSGCGKTTNLRMIAGLLDPTEGEIRIGGKSVNNVPIHKRNLGIVFQNYALFPHKSVADNVAFGLKYRNVPSSEIPGRVQKALDLVQLPDVGDRYPKALSGGQQQRIALARAIVIEPDVLLLDEPLSALDANLREDMRVELKRIQDQIGVTTVFVTHDQSEALAMSDQIVVMSAGRVEQVGTPEEVYNRPASEFVANFLGASNIIEGTCSGKDAETVALDVPVFGKVPVPADKAPKVSEGAAKLVLRAEKLQLMPQGADTTGMVTSEAVVETVDYQGQTVRYFIRAGDRQFQAINMIDGHPFAEGTTVTAGFRPVDCAALPG
ncbi:putative spermidine/putrescine transport system ATP-binding protein/spermidine/putrescine transport system ATP-binding protein [Mameliella alba]|uniref:ABC transporter ATP-binding protein n=1 Tax=Mameliella alba TaxID=561184 RepID=UPI0008907BC7|nr:ABC transporter ATP-binding protein [Mameliella alba]MBV6636369.1 ABC transporter ATP-binding protein [Mameliella sp.]OWV43560.1 polyamine ABC transporter ATP-binding protein [Mameliella alba]PTR36195.1 putative spermidine/putrescine transport system ATP-binding protein [Mameliella alba]SDE00019.1 putative spermidine/putrescine transport system ATP-binding protein/spermidine/putrescine transport system ATP-binding protein [Mameliella alba]GGF80457.1 polyamine-transporting ATPase [Mameliella